MMVKQRYRNSVKSSWSYPGADVQKRWKEYIKVLYDKDGMPRPEDMGIESEDSLQEKMRTARGQID